MKCGNSHLPTDLEERLRGFGSAIHQGLQLQVFDGGLVGFEAETENEVIKDVTGKEAGPQSGSRSRQRAWTRGAQAADHAFGSDALEAAYGAQFRVLARHYQALAFEDRNGLWVVVRCNPLGPRGPEVHFVVAFPLDQRIAPRGWAITVVGKDSKPMSLKHTNFPDASICAFPHGHIAWPSPDGMVGLVDIFTLWAVRKLHRDHFGWWPGPQLGAGAHYRLREFDPREDCHCGSEKRYGDCHMATDILVEPQVAKDEFRRLFECEFDDRRLPTGILGFARSKWRDVPSMAEMFALRKDPTGLQLS